jgi:hypothetical protein
MLKLNLHKIALSLTVVLFLSTACQPGGPSTEQLAATMVAETAAAVPTEAPPTATTVPTNTPLPSPTATPAPLMIEDDFSSKSDIWGECEVCEWKDGALYFGPYPPKESMGQDQVFYVTCEACGWPKYYRIAADVTPFEGYSGDRTFGLLAGLVGNDFLGAATITTHQHVLYETFDFNTQSWGGSPFKLYPDAVQYGSGATNRIEVEVKPGTSSGSAEINIFINGTKTISYEQEAEQVKVGLYLGWHSVGVKYDNFEFEELEP